MDRRMEGKTDGPTDRHTHLQRCEDAYKKEEQTHLSVDLFQFFVFQTERWKQLNRLETLDKRLVALLSSLIMAEEEEEEGDLYDDDYGINSIYGGGGGRGRFGQGGVISFDECGTQTTDSYDDIRKTTMSTAVKDSHGDATSVIQESSVIAKKIDNLREEIVSTSDWQKAEFGDLNTYIDGTLDAAEKWQVQHLCHLCQQQLQRQQLRHQQLRQMHLRQLCHLYHPICTL